MSDIYIVAVKSDEYDNEAILPDVLRTKPELPSFNSHDQSRTRAFRSLEAARAYYDSFNGKAEFGDELSIFKVMMGDE